MNTGILTFLIWLIGFIVVIVGHVFIKRVINKNTRDTISYDIYNGCKYGIFSWLSILTIITYYISYIIAKIDENIKNKLNNK